jgi:hypothetical protein
MQAHGSTLWRGRTLKEPVGSSDVAKCTEVIDFYAKDTPRYRDFTWRRGIEADTRFGFVDELGINKPQPSSPQLAVDRALSTSFIAALQPAEQQLVAERIQPIVAFLGERFDYPYRSEMQVWKLNTTVSP